MSTMGRNMKLTVDEAHRGALRRVMVELLGAKNQAVSDAFEVFLLEDGFNLGVYFAEGGGMSSAEARDRGVWIELLVDDVNETNQRLLEGGVERCAYDVDPENTYFWLPGGPVFRLGTR